MNKNTNMLGVVFDAKEFTLDSHRSDFYIPFNKTEEYFSVYENEVAFIKKCEDLVRKHTFYSTYIKYLINVVGMKTCQVLPGIECGDNKGKVTIEMHHGPILTLYDTCKIVLNYLRYHQYEDITTFKVANIVVEEHRLNNVRVMLVSKTVHQKIHDDSIVLNYQMGFGGTKEFLEKYYDGLDKTYIHAINEYIEWSKSNDSCDNDVLSISDTVKKYNDNDFDEFDAFMNRREIKFV